ncbi:hypothetical protein TWF694_001137 [Orbilia ellipsospora]|uniref:HMG box domain-containing protein n=1 Tax=Orbilia ellipsospora TaxID=2528407 RepID=A0AAV9XQS3_9PEZI
MLAVGRSRLAAGGPLSLPKLSAIVARALARSGPLSSGIANAVASPATFAPFVKANLPVLTNLVLREYATAAKKKTTATKKKTTTKKPAAKKKTTTTKKKPTARRTVASKSGTRRAAPKKRAAAKKKKPVKKKVVRKKKKVEKKPGIRSEYKKILKPPPTRMTGYMLFYGENFQTVATAATFKEKVQQMSSKWQSLAEAEKNSYNDRAAAEKIKRKAAYDEWLRKQNPADIKVANLAALRLNTYYEAKGKKARQHTLSDDRLPKHPLSSYILYSREALRKPEFINIKPNVEKVRQVAAAWRALSESEKKKYVDLANRDKIRYQNEKKEFERKYKPTLA